MSCILRIFYGNMIYMGLSPVEIDAGLHTAKFKKVILSPEGIFIYRYLFIAAGLLNFSLILFDYLYLEELPFGKNTLRDVFRNTIPAVTESYDSVKGIEPHRFTESYIQDYKLFKEAVLRDDVLTSRKYAGLLYEKSENMIDMPSGSGPFSSGKGDGQLEVIKNHMKRFAGTDSARDGFGVFFIVDGIEKNDLENRFVFFEKNILPVLEKNYYRSIDEDGKFLDHFYLIDRWFVYFFIFDFLSRWIVFAGASSFKKFYLFPVRRWYEVFNLFYPHHAVWFRLMRALPLYIRMRETGVIANREGLIPEIIHDNASVIAKEISVMVLSNLLVQASSVVKSLDSKDMKSILEGESGENLKLILRDFSNILLKDVLPAMSDDFALYVRNIVRGILDPWLTTPIAPVVRVAMLNMEITIQDAVDSAFYTESGRDELRMLMMEFMDVFLKSLAEDENFEPLKMDLANFLERTGREMAVIERID